MFLYAFDLFIFKFYREMFCLASRASWGPLTPKYCVQALSQYQTIAAGQAELFQLCIDANELVDEVTVKVLSHKLRIAQS